LRFGWCLCALSLASIIGILLYDQPAALVLTSICLLLAAIGLVRDAASRCLGTPRTLCVLFYFLACTHVLVGFFMAGLTTDRILIRSNAVMLYAQATLIASIGLFAGALGYRWKLDGGASIRQGWPVVVDMDLAEKLFRLLLACGAALMFFMYWRLGVTQFLMEPAKWPFMRYITSDVFGGTARDEWFVNRAMDLLTVSLPFIVFRAVRRPKFLNILLISVGYCALFLPLRRANLLGVIFASVVLVGIGRKDVYQLTRRVLVIVAAVYIVSQCVFLLGAFASDLDPRSILEVSSTGLPEIRDLGWTLNLLNGDKLNGVTFAQALLPLPSIASDWSATHSLRAISTKLIGSDLSGQTGGLRLTIMGEGYINFGYIGLMVVCFLWGWGVAWCDQMIRAAEKSKSGFAGYVAVMCFMWISFFIYLGGTSAAAVVKMGALLVLGVAWVSKYRPRIRQIVPEPQT
jgi:hypothetical protein